MLKRLWQRLFKKNKPQQEPPSPRDEAMARLRQISIGENEHRRKAL